MVLHGPHQVAWKSTMVYVDEETSLSKCAVEVAGTVLSGMVGGVWWCEDEAIGELGRCVNRRGLFVGGYEVWVCDAMVVGRTSVDSLRGRRRRRRSERAPIGALRGGW